MTSHNESNDTVTAISEGDPMVMGFFDPRTWTITYVVWDDETHDAVIVDPVLDYDPAASKIWTESADRVIQLARGKELNVHFILETHAHADHLSGAQHVKDAFPDAQIAIGERITEVQKLFRTVFGLPPEFPTDGRQFDRLLRDGEEIEAGSLHFRAIFTPGHTPACASYVVGDAVFTGDTLFMPDMGSGRCDFPGGSAESMYHSIAERLYDLPDETRVFVGHDYQPGGREIAWETTIGAEKRENIQITADTTEEEYVTFRNERDATLSAPRLLFQSVQVNIDAGALPKPQDNDKRYLRIPINVFRPDPAGEMTLDEV